MKIRTDFVTNSSSSSFCVEIELQMEDGSRFSMETKASDYGSNTNLNLNAEQVLSSSSVSELMELIKKSANGTGKKKIKEFTEELEGEITSFEDISNLTLRRIFSAWGEASSCQIRNDDELLQLARNLLDTTDKEKQSGAEDAFTNYLQNSEVEIQGGWQDFWPTGFCGVKSTPRYSWEYLGLTPKKLAQKLVDNELSSKDLAVEAVTFDFKAGTFKGKADYLIDSREKGLNLKPTSRSLAYYHKVLSESFPEYQIKESVPITELIPSCDTPCDDIDFAFFKDSLPCLVIAVKTENNAKSKTFKEIKKQCEHTELDCLILANDKDNQEKKVISKVQEQLFKELYDVSELDSRPTDAEYLPLAQEGTGTLVKVKFGDGRAYEYNCFADIPLGSIVYVDGARAAKAGKIVEKYDQPPIKGYYNVLKIEK